MKTTLLLFLFLTISLYAGNEQAQSQLDKVNKNFFIENKGQWPSEVLYLAKVGGMNAWITNSGVVYDYYQINRNYNESETMKMTPDKKQEFEGKNTSIKGHVIKMQFVDANNYSSHSGNNQQSGYFNYFIGNEKNKWASDVPLYGDIAQNEVYKSVNVKYYFDGNSIRYDYIVKPGADLSQIRLKFEGQESINVNEAGELVLRTSLGEVTNGKLYSYQTENGIKSEVTCRFKNNTDGTISFEANSYDRNKELTIDPLVYSTFLGGSNNEVGSSIAINGSGNAYLTGYTNSSNFPTTTGAYQTIFYFSYDAFVTKLNPAGSALVYSTLLGGQGKDYGFSIAIDTHGDVFITGETSSSNFPITTGAYMTIIGGLSDAFVAKLNPTGSALVYSTFIGGNSGDLGTSIAIDTSGDAYITGQTGSSNFPTSTGAFQTNLGGPDNAFETKLNPTGSALVYSTYLGGNDEDAGNSIAIDANGNSYITGITNSTNFPTTVGAYQPVFGGVSGAYDAFVTKLNPTGTALVYSTFIGGKDDDQGKSIAIDGYGDAYITGQTFSSNFPTTSGVYQSASGGNTDAFVTKLNPTGSALVYSTYLGGNDNDFGYAIAIDTAGNAYISGQTASSNFPTTLGVYQSILGGGIDAFIAELNSTGSVLIYSSFLGGSTTDYFNSIAIDASGNAYMTGQTYSSNFPTTTGAYQINLYSIYSDAFVTKLNIPPILLQLTAPIGGEVWGENTVHNITWLEGAQPSSNIKVDFSTDAGSTWINLNNIAPGKGTYNWTVPPFPCTTTKVRVSLIGESGYSSQSAQNFTITANPATAVFVTFPNGGNSVKAGSTRNITWTASPGISNLNVELTTDNGSTWSFVANSIAATNGSYSWTVPNAPSAYCKIRLTDASAATDYDVSDSVFSIKSLTVNSPIGGEVWKSGLTKNILWTQVGIVNVKIEYSTNNGTNWNSIVTSYSASSGNYSWTVPSVSSTQCLVRISDASDTSVNSQSNNIFTIWQPVVVSQTPIVGQNTLSFGATNILLDMFVFTAAAITDTFYAYQAPVAGTLPTGINNISQYYWTIFTSGTISFINGYIEVPLSSLVGVINPANLVWLKRTNSGDPWTNIGGTITGSNLVSTAAFSSFSEFAIGTTGSDPLPVQLVSFTGKQTKGNVLLTWETITETQNSGFNIERKTAADKEFKKIGYIKGSGNSGAPKQYSFADNSSEGGKVTYRLGQVNLNGLVTYSNEIEINIIPSEYILYQNYPNPFNPSTIIKYQLPKAGLVTIVIYDVLGKKVATLVNENKDAGFYYNVFDASKLASGIYIYQIKSNEYILSKTMMLIK